MESIKIRQRVEQDSILHLDIPIKLTNREIEAVVIYQPVQSTTPAENSLALLHGRCADAPIVLEDRGLSETLNETQHNKTTMVASLL